MCAPPYRIPKVLHEKTLRTSVRILSWCVIQDCCGPLCFVGTENGVVNSATLKFVAIDLTWSKKSLKLFLLLICMYKACNSYGQKAFLTDKCYPLFTETTFRDDRRHSASAVSRSPRLSFQCTAEY